MSRGRPRKITLGDDTRMAAYYEVKQLIRKIAMQYPEQTDVDSIEEVDKSLDEWYKLGYRLFNTHVLSSSNDKTTNVLYVLHRAVEPE